MKSLPQLLTAVATGVMLLCSPAISRADFRIQISDGTSTVTVVDGGVGDMSSTAGQIVASVVIGNFRQDIQVGSSKPLIGGPMDAAMHLGTTVTANRYGGTLTILLSDTDFTYPGINPHQVNLTSTTSGMITGGSGTFTWQPFFDAANVDFSMGGLSTPQQSTFGTVTGTGSIITPFSITEKLVLVAPTQTSGNTFFSLNNSADAQALVPEPTGFVQALVLFPTFAGNYYFLRRRAHKS